MKIFYYVKWECNAKFCCWKQNISSILNLTFSVWRTKLFTFMCSTTPFRYLFTLFKVLRNRERQRATRTTKRNKKFHFTFRTPFLSVPFGLKHAINTLHSENKNRGKIVNHTYCDLWLSDFRFVVCDLIWIAYRYILLLFNFLHFL